jgi:phage shock protein PspC (stress-responsive transcriptional regulator)
MPRTGRWIRPPLQPRRADPACSEHPATQADATDTRRRAGVSKPVGHFSQSTPDRPQIDQGEDIMATRMVRPRDNRMIAGVCAGLAQRFGVSPTTVRVIFVVSCLLPGPQFVLYLLLWVLMPSEKDYREAW